MSFYSRFHPKLTVEECKKIDLALIKKSGLFKEGTYTKAYISWSYHNSKKDIAVIFVTLGETWEWRHIKVITEQNNEIIDETLYLKTIPCNYGGKRYLFFCPICLKKVRILYLPPNLPRFGCRHCLNLTYQSRNESRSLLHCFFCRLWKADDLEEKLKRRYWRRKPTRKYRKILKLRESIDPFCSAVLEKMDQKSKSWEKQRGIKKDELST